MRAFLLGVVGFGGLVLCLPAGCGEPFTTAAPCATAEDCGTPSACVTFRCDNQRCVADPIDGALPPAAQEAGDCHVARCVHGQLEDLIDDDDVPNDGDDCVEARCSGGVPSTMNKPQGTPCGNGALTCNDEGKCSGCTEPSQCGAANACTEVACHQGICDVRFATPGTSLPDPVPHDCQARVCVENGVPMDVADDSDVKPADPFECSYPVCSGGTTGQELVEQGQPCTGQEAVKVPRVCCGNTCCQVPGVGCAGNMCLGVGGQGGGGGSD